MRSRTKIQLYGFSGINRCGSLPAQAMQCTVRIARGMGVQASRSRYGITLVPAASYGAALYKLKRRSGERLYDAATTLLRHCRRSFRVLKLLSVNALGILYV